MALQYPGFVVPRGYDGSISDIFDQWNQGEAAGKAQRFEDQAPDQFAKTLPPLSEYGLTTSPEDLKAMFANPNTRALALAQVQEASQRRSDAMDPLKQAQLKKAQYEVQHLGDAPRNVTLENANTRMKLGWENGLRGDALRTYVLTGDLPKEAAGPNAPSGYRYNDTGNLEFIPGGPADPALAGNKPPTDADVRTQKLSSVIQGDKELLLGKDGESGLYNALTDLGSQIASTDVGVGGVGIGKPGYALSSPDYQSAANALTNIAQSYLYAVSGQAAPAGEVAKIVDSVTPKIGESEQSVKAKRDRLKSYINAIEISKQNAPDSGNGQGNGNTTSTGVTWSVSP